MLVEVNSVHGGDGVDVKGNRLWVKAVISSKTQVVVVLMWGH